ncbi:MAG: LCP family protein, partial [Erysipelotrichaceae bacterium]|nr:LCP family protein [Erysipelotrichaceae bacterium]
NLINDKIDALIITDSYLNLLKKSFPTLEEDIRVVEVFQKQIEVTVSTSDKDIRYETFTVLISGIDDVGDPNVNKLSDVNMLLIVNPQAHKIQMVSFPRDAFVPNPALGNGNDKLTHTGNNGVENTLKAVETLLGLDIDFYAKVSFSSIIEVVNAIGGIEVDVELSFTEQDENRSFADSDIIHLEAGLQTINGRQALAYARHRYTDGYGDIGRTRAQQRVIQGIINKLLTPEGISKINNLLKIAQQFIGTNMPLQQITNFISYQLDRIKPWSIDSFTVEATGAMLTTASMGSNLPLSVQLLHKDSVQKILDVYTQLSNQMKMNTFSFDLDDLTKDQLTLPKNSNVVWAGMDTSAYQAVQTIPTPVTEEVDDSSSQTDSSKEETTTPPSNNNTTTPPSDNDSTTTTPEKPDDSTTKPDPIVPPSTDSGSGDNTTSPDNKE